MSIGLSLGTYSGLGGAINRLGWITHKQKSLRQS